MSKTTSIRTDLSTPTDCDPISLWTPEDGSFGTVVVRIQGVEDFFNQKIGEGPISSFSFDSYEQMYKAFTPARVAILRLMAGAGPLSIREVARRAERDFKGVHNDVTALLRDGYLKKTPEGRVIFPYDGIRFEFDLPAHLATVAAE